jgi:hypothetical protein
MAGRLGEVPEVAPWPVTVGGLNPVMTKIPKNMTSKSRKFEFVSIHFLPVYDMPGIFLAICNYAS